MQYKNLHNNNLQGVPIYFLLKWEHHETNMVEEYCWTITWGTEQSCCSWSGSCVLNSEFQLDTYTHTHTNTHTRTHACTPTHPPTHIQLTTCMLKPNLRTNYLCQTFQNVSMVPIREHLCVVWHSSRQHCSLTWVSINMITEICMAYICLQYSKKWKWHSAPCKLPYNTKWNSKLVNRRILRFSDTSFRIATTSTTMNKEHIAAMHDTMERML